MSHLYLKTDYEETFVYTEKKTLYCHHNLSSDVSVFYDDEDGVKISRMEFMDNDFNCKYEAFKRLMSPYKDESMADYKDGVEWWSKKK